MSQSPHDALFKGIFKNPSNASPVLRTALPAGLVRHLDFRTLRLEDGSFVDENLRSQYSDLLFSIVLAGRSARLYLLYEHQKPRVVTPLRCPAGQVTSCASRPPLLRLSD